MRGNGEIETLVGGIPVLGDVCDAGWKANVRNVALSDGHLRAPEKARRASALVVAGTVVGLVATAGFAVWSAVWIVGWIVDVMVALA